MNIYRMYTSIVSSTVDIRLGSTTNLFSDKPLRTGVDVTLLGLPRGFRGVLSSLLSKLDRRGVTLNLQGKKNKINQQVIMA